MSTDQRIKEAKTLIARGEKIYRACERVGISIDYWYRNCGGMAEIRRKQKVERLKARRALLASKLEAVDGHIAELERK